jgi:DNA repair protein RadC
MVVMLGLIALSCAAVAVFVSTEQKCGGVLEFGAKCAQQRKYVNLVKHEKPSGGDCRTKLRKNFAENGLKNFCEREIVEFLLALGLANQKSVSVADAMLETFESVRGIFEASVNELAKINDAVESVAAFFQFILTTGALENEDEMENIEDDIDDMEEMEDDMEETEDEMDMEDEN